MLKILKSDLRSQTIHITNAERQLLIRALDYEINLVVQLPDRKVMKNSLKAWLRKFRNGLDTIDLGSDRIGKVEAGGELAVDINEYRLYHTYNIGDWKPSEMPVYKRLRDKLTEKGQNHNGDYEIGV